MSNSLDYHSGQPAPVKTRRFAIAGVSAWLSMACGLFAVVCIPELVAARTSIAGFLFGPWVWLIAAAGVVTAIVAVVIRPCHAAAWIGLLSSAFATVWCTVYIMNPPTRKDF